jgi:uncharacterized protein (TIGR02284 family)
MDENKKLIDTVNHVIRINKDRVEGYKLAARETEDPQLKNLFAKFSADSMKFREELVAYVTRLGGKPAEDTTQQGKVYRAWMEIKKALTGRDRHAIIASCEYGEDAALEAYDDALKADVVMAADLRELLHQQRLHIREAHDQIKAMRDAVVA